MNVMDFNQVDTGYMQNILYEFYHGQRPKEEHATVG